MASGKSLKLFLRMMRHPGTPESIGRGVASGLFVAFLFPVGHMLAAFFLAMLVRGTRSAAVLVTWITNPLTIPFIWPVQCCLGGFLTGRPLSYKLAERMLRESVHAPSMKTAGELGGELLASFFAGGLVLGTLLAVIGYFSTIAAVRHHRARLAGRKENRMNRWKTEGC